MRINTRKFEAAHGTKPRGEGNWIFTFTRAGAGGTETQQAPSGMTFSEARTWANRVGREMGATEATVES